MSEQPNCYTLMQRDAFSDFFINNLKWELDSLVKVSLEEDLNQTGDVTTNAIINYHQEGLADIFSKQEGIFCGGFAVQQVFFTLDPLIQVQLNFKEGNIITKNQSVITIKGSLKSILTGERTALNFLARMSGIATLTNHFVQQTKGTPIQILDTRKTLPGWRYLDKYSVVVGGGQNHRIGLFDMVLIKENHIAAAGNITHAINCCKKYLHGHDLDLKIEVETKSIEEVKAAVRMGVDRIMLDNISPEQIQEAVLVINSEAEVEISGGVNLANFKDVARTGVDYISIGQLTHSATAFDYSLLIS